MKIYDHPARPGFSMKNLLAFWIARLPLCQPKADSLKIHQEKSGVFNFAFWKEKSSEKQQIHILSQLSNSSLKKLIICAGSLHCHMEMRILIFFQRKKNCRFKNNVFDLKVGLWYDNGPYVWLMHTKTRIQLKRFRLIILNQTIQKPTIFVI